MQAAKHKMIKVFKGKLKDDINEQKKPARLNKRNGGFKYRKKKYFTKGI